MPYDVNLPGHYYPCVVPADGNCLPHSFSTFSNMKADEGRVRITIEAVQHEETYLEHSFLKDGLNTSCKDVPLAYAMYSLSYVAGDIYTKRKIAQVYEDEVLSCSRSGVSMGIWQIHQMSSVLQRPVISIYPTDRGVNARKHLDRKIYLRGTNYQ